MRVVEYQPDVSSTPYQLLRAVGILGAIFSLVIAFLIIANHLTLKRTDPIHSPALIKLTEELKANPRDESLKAEIRELDYLARHAFFSSQFFTRISVYLLLGGVVVAVVAFKTMQAYKPKIPFPNHRDPREDLVLNATWARKAVTVAGLLLVGFALSLAIPWKSPLDQVAAVETASAKSVSTPADQPPQHAATSLPVPDRAEVLKNWPILRGPAQGHTASTHLPIAWDSESGQGIVWKSVLPKPGFSSPIIWNNLIFLSGADEQSREVLCYKADNGELAWRQQVKDVPGSPAELPKVSSDTGYAAPTMATDGTRLFAIFANGDLVSLDFQGNLLWNRNMGMPENPYGHSSSLVVFEHTLFVQFDHNGKAGLYALDLHNGNTRWQAPRTFGSSWSSPLLVTDGDKPELILAAEPPVISYDPRSGQELWRVDCLEGAEVVTVPVYAQGFVFVSVDNAGFIAIDLSKKAVAWKKEDYSPGVSTPVVSGDLLFFGLNDGGIVCLNATTGDLVWQQETDSGFYASPILAGDRVYLMDRQGEMHIFSAADKFNLLGKGKLGEETVSTPAILGNSIIYRGTKHLFRIGS